MMNLEEAKRILAALEREEVEYVLIGSMAMAAQGLIHAMAQVE
jgi:septum formation inhibitor-activating ATPase MinD